MNLRDKKNPGSYTMSSETTTLSQSVKDRSKSLIDRLESFEDIISLEVGDTSLTRLRSAERAFNIRQLFIKFEGNNPTGTQKDRIAFSQVHDALRRGYHTIALATCGNYGAAVALAASLAGLRCIIYIPAGYHTNRIEEMEAHLSEIVRPAGDYEDAVRLSSQHATKNKWYDANPGGINTPLQIMAYSQIALEIYDHLREAPKYCAVPVSNGTLLAGIYRGFVNLYKRGKTSRIPKMIAASSTQKNPIIESFLKGLDTCVDLDPAKIRETKYNEPLINWHSFDGNEALFALRASQGSGFSISDQRLIEMSSFIKKNEGLQVLPASTAGLVGLLLMHHKQPLEPDRFVAVITAKNK